MAEEVSLVGPVVIPLVSAFGGAALGSALGAWSSRSILKKQLKADSNARREERELERTRRRRLQEEEAAAAIVPLLRDLADARRSHRNWSEGAKAREAIIHQLHILPEPIRRELEDAVEIIDDAPMLSPHHHPSHEGMIIHHTLPYAVQLARSVQLGTPAPKRPPRVIEYAHARRDYLKLQRDTHARQDEEAEAKHAKWLRSQPGELLDELRAADPDWVATPTEDDEA